MFFPTPNGSLGSCLFATAVSVRVGTFAPGLLAADTRVLPAASVLDCGAAGLGLGPVLATGALVAGVLAGLGLFGCARLDPVAGFGAPAAPVGILLTAPVELIGFTAVFFWPPDTGPSADMDLLMPSP